MKPWPWEGNMQNSLVAVIETGRALHALDLTKRLAPRATQMQCARALSELDLAIDY